MSDLKLLNSAYVRLNIYDTFEKSFNETNMINWKNINELWFSQLSFPIDAQSPLLRASILTPLGRFNFLVLLQRMCIACYGVLSHPVPLGNQPSPSIGFIQQERLATWKYIWRLSLLTPLSASLPCLLPAYHLSSAFLLQLHVDQSSLAPILPFPSRLCSTSAPWSLHIQKKSRNNIHLGCARALDAFLISVGSKIRTPEGTL